MPLNMKLSFAHSNVAAVEGAWPVMGFTSHQQMHGYCCARCARKAGLQLRVSTVPLRHLL
jgi:hypothetical protein